MLSPSFHTAARDRQLSAEAFRLLGVLTAHLDYISYLPLPNTQTAFGRVVGKGQSAVSRQLKQLLERGYLAKEVMPEGGVGYRLTHYPIPRALAVVKDSKQVAA